MKLTKQGVRDLDAMLGDKTAGHVGRTAKEDQRRCAHIWELHSCEYGCWVVGECHCPAWRCRTCGKVE